MATYRDNFQIFVELLGIPEMNAQARSGLSDLQSEFSKVFNQDISFGGGAPAIAKAIEAKFQAALSAAQTGRQRAQAELDKLFDPKYNEKAAQYQRAAEALDKPVRYTNATATEPSRPYKQDESAKITALQKQDVEVLNEIVAAREKLLKAQGTEFGVHAQLMNAQEKRVKAEYDASEAGQQAANYAKLDAQRQREMPAYLNRVQREREAAERAIIAAEQKEAKEQQASVDSVERQRRTALARESVLEANARNNPLTGPLTDYQKPLAEGTHEPERSQVALTTAQSEVTSSMNRIKEVWDLARAGELDDIAATKAMASARRQLTGAVQRETLAQERLDSESGGFAAQFQRGFKGASDRPYAEQLGQAVKFSAFYGVAYKLQFALLQTFRDALTQGEEFQQGLSDMAIITGRSKTSLSGLAETLGQIASNAGATPSEGLQIGARSLGLYGLAGSSDHAQQDYVAKLSAEVVSKLHLTSGDEVLKLQEDLAAITNASGLGAGGQIRVADLDAYFAKQFGTTPGATLQAAAPSAQVGIASGFSLEQIQALAAQIIARTGQTPTAVGGYLATIFSREGKGTLNKVADGLGIQTNDRNGAQIFAELAKAYEESGSAAKAQITGAFGRGGKMADAVTAALEGFSDVNKKAKAAQQGAADGALQNTFYQRLNNIGGQIAVLGGHLKEFAHLLGETGMLTSLGLIVESFDQMLTATNALLQVFDALPGPLKALLSTLALAGIARATGVTGMIGKSTFGTTLGVAALDAGGGARGVLAMGKAAFGMVGPMLAVTAGITALGKTIESVNNIHKQQQAGATAIEQAPGYGATSGALRTYASLLSDQARNLHESNNGLWGHIGDFFTAGNPDEQARMLSAQARHATTVAERLDQFTKPDQPGVIASLSKDDITAGLDQVTATGGTAAQRLHALGIAIAGVGKAAEAADSKIDPGRLGIALESATKNLPKRLTVDNSAALQAGVAAGNASGRYYEAVRSFDTSGVVPDIQKALPSDKLGSILQASLAAQGITDFKSLTPDAAGKAADAAVAQIKTGGGINTQNLSVIREAYAKVIKEGLLNVGKSAVDVINGAERLTNEQAAIVMPQLLQEVSGRLGEKSNADYAGRLSVLRTGLSEAMKARAVADDKNLPIITQTIDNLHQQMVGIQIERLEALRHAAVASAKNQGQATALGRRFVASEIQRIIKGGGSVDQLVAVLATAGNASLAAARKAIEDAIAVAKTALAVEDAMSTAVTSMTNAAVAEAGVAAGDKSKKTRKEIRRLNKLLGALQYVTPDASPDQLSGAGAGETAAERRAAQLAAAAARSGGDIAAARAAIAQARADMQKAKPGTVEYYNALASFYQAQDQLTQAFRNYRHILGELRIDQTDPVAEAQLALTEARRKLRQDRSKAPDVRAQDKLDVQNAQTSLESEKFNQRLSDVQTAEQLGRISHAAYIQYLNSEHNRLSAISKRTRQQQDELNQIDQLMKDAAGQMAGAFNIGDIKLPTPYEVRRYIKSAVVSTPYALGAGSAGGTTTIYINGADTGAVKRIIDENVGKGTRVLTTTTRRT